MNIQDIGYTKVMDIQGIVYTKVMDIQGIGYTKVMDIQLVYDILNVWISVHSAYRKFRIYQSYGYPGNKIYYSNGYSR